MRRRGDLHVGLVCSELFDAKLGGFGGFGFAARRSAEVLGALPGVRVSALMPVPLPDPSVVPAEVGGLPLIAATGDVVTDSRRFRADPPDVLLTIDWLPRFLVPALALPRTPVIVWSRDPRPPAEWAHIGSLALPPVDAGLGVPGPRWSGEDTLEGGENGRGPRTLRAVWRSSVLSGRPIELAVPARGLLPAIRDLYGFLPRRTWGLGTPVESSSPIPDPRDDHRSSPTSASATTPEPSTPGSASPRPIEVVFVGRLDPVKRPWLVWALASALPDMHFTVLGSARDGVWAPPARTPPNLRVVGHAGGSVKARLLADADILVNTSIHEGLPVSMVEALSTGAALVATADVEGLVARFGIAVPNQGGDGLGLVAPLATSLRTLAADEARRRQIAIDGPAWVASRHAEAPFLAQMSLLLDAVGRPLPVAAALHTVGPPARAGVRPGRDTTTADPSTGDPSNADLSSADLSSADPGVAGASRGSRSPTGPPDFVVIGAARAGTTALHHGLVAHAGVFVPPAKEPRFFAADGMRPDFTGPWDDAGVNARTVWPANDYVALFADAPVDVPRGEVSPLYLGASGAAERLARANPEARIVAVLRDPVERAHSQWRLHRMWGQDDLSFAEALAAEPRRLAAGWSPLYGYRARGEYHRLLAPYLDAFGRDAILLVAHDDLVTDPTGTLDRVVAFVGGDPGPGRDTGRRPAELARGSSTGSPVTSNHDARNEGVVPRSPWLADQLRGRGPRLARALAGPRRADALLAKAEALNTVDAVIDPALRADLAAHYAPDLLALRTTYAFTLRS